MGIKEKYQSSDLMQQASRVAFASQDEGLYTGNTMESLGMIGHGATGKIRMSAAEEKNIKAAGEKALKRMRVASGQGGLRQSMEHALPLVVQGLMSAGGVLAQHPASHQVSCSHPFRVSSLGILMQRSRRLSTGQMPHTFRILENLEANRRHMDTHERFWVEKSILKMY